MLASVKAGRDICDIDQTNIISPVIGWDKNTTKLLWYPSWYFCLIICFSILTEIKQQIKPVIHDVFIYHDCVDGITGRKFLPMGIINLIIWYILFFILISKNRLMSFRLTNM